MQHLQVGDRLPVQDADQQVAPRPRRGVNITGSRPSRRSRVATARWWRVAGRRGSTPAGTGRRTRRQSPRGSPRSPAHTRLDRAQVPDPEQVVHAVALAGASSIPEPRRRGACRSGLRLTSSAPAIACGLRGCGRGTFSVSTPSVNDAWTEPGVCRPGREGCARSDRTLARSAAPRRYPSPSSP